MSVETLPYVYTSQDEIERVLSEVATQLRTSDLGGSDKKNYWDELVADATDRMNLYVLRFYEAEDLATNSWCRRRTTWIALVYLLRRKGNPVPKSVMERYDEIMGELELIRLGQLQIPRLATSNDMTPAMSNVSVSDWHRVDRIRVKSAISTGGTYGQQSVELPWWGYDWF